MGTKAKGKIYLSKTQQQQIYVCMLFHPVTRIAVETLKIHNLCYRVSVKKIIMEGKV